MRLRAPVLLLALLGLVAAPPAPAIRLPAPGMLSANGEIKSITRAGDRLILAGTFTRIGPFVGGGVGLDPASGAIDPSFPRVDGQVSDAISDGRGGWYVGGQFRFIGDAAARNVAHLLSDGSVDPAFRAGAADLVTSLVLAGGRLYAGQYEADNGQPAGGRVIAMDAATGARVETFKPKAYPSVSELELAGERLYIGYAAGVAAVDPQTGAEAPGFSFACENCDEQPNRITGLAHHGDLLYVATERDGVAGVDLATGTPDPGFLPRPTSAPEFSVDFGPLVLAVDGNRLLVGGRGMGLGGRSSSLVALDLETGAADPDFAAGFDAPVHDMVLTGDVIVASGAGRLDASPRLTTLDRATGAVRTVANTGLDGPVDALAAGAERIFAGGRFGTSGESSTDGVAAVDARTGRLVPGFRVHEISSFSFGAALPPPEVAGPALIFSRHDRNGDDELTVHLAAVSRRTGNRLSGFRARPISFDPRGAPGQYYPAVVRARGNRVYVAHADGPGTSVWPQSRVKVLSARTGRRISDLQVPRRGYINDMLLRGSRVYLAGSFRRRHADGRPRHLATLALNSSTGAIDESFDAHTHGPVYRLGQTADRLYLSGLFDRVGDRRRRNLASVQPIDGAVDAGFRARIGSAPYTLGAPFDAGRGLLGLRGRYPGLDPIFLSARTGRRADISQLEGSQGVGQLLMIGRRPYVSAQGYALPFYSYDPSRTYAGFLPPAKQVG